jgi:hypothetical protein
MISKHKNTGRMYFLEFVSICILKACMSFKSAVLICILMVKEYRLVESVKHCLGGKAQVTYASTIQHFRRKIEKQEANRG